MGYFHRVFPCVFHTYVSLPQGNWDIITWLFPNQTHQAPSPQSWKKCTLMMGASARLMVWSKLPCGTAQLFPKTPNPQGLYDTSSELNLLENPLVVIFWILEIGNQGSFEKYCFIRLLVAIIQQGSKWLVLMFQSFPRENHGCSIKLNHPESTTMELTFENKQLSWNWTSVQLQT